MAFDIEQSSSKHPDCGFIRENAEAFVLGALTEDESRRIVNHTAEHRECQAAIDSAARTASALAFSMPLIDGPDLAIKLKLFDRIAAESTTPATGLTRIETGNQLIAAMNPPTREPIAIAPRQRNWTQYLSAALVAPLAIALAVVSLWAYNLNDELDTVRDQSATESVASAPTNVIEMYSMENSGTESSARGSLGAMPNQTSAVLLAWDLDPEEDHEVWCEESDGAKWMVSALEVDDDGAAMQTIKFPKPIDGYKRIYVSGSEDSATEGPELILTMPEKSRPEDEAATPPA